MQLDHFYAVVEDCEALIERFGEGVPATLEMKTRYGEKLLRILEKHD
jgi:hypothetical protein